uniref:Putative radical SAM superfamily protein n=1 Tax=viral metagenome TaxID=1070528 RepID=A0A6M3IVD7_9ZZZZ
MRVLFITDPFQVEPLGLGYLASSIKRHDHQSTLVTTDDLTWKDLVDIDVVGYSITTGKHKRFLELNRKLKGVSKFISVFGGSHPTYFPEMIKEDGVDAIVRGEGEKSFTDFLDITSLRKIDKVEIGFAPLEQNLDSLPFPDREFLYKYPINRINPIKNVMTSRGCRFSCPYCFNSLYRSFYKDQTWVRFRSVKNVIDECKELKNKYHAKFIFFQDDEFLSNPNLMDLLDTYRYKIAIPFHCQIRIELLTYPIAKCLQAAGCTGVTFAIESGSEQIRKDLLNRKMSDGKIMWGVNILHEVGLKFRTENMIGLPGETYKDMIKTLDFNAQCKPTIGWASIFQPYPRLPLANCTDVNDFHESFFTDTMVNKRDRVSIIKLQRLFGLLVSHPGLRWLLLLPNNKIFDKIYQWWKQRRYNVLFR